MGNASSLTNLVKQKVASRLHKQDDSLFDFSPEARDSAAHFMGWTDLASNPPYKIKHITKLADRFIKSGIRYVLHVGQGGSTQAAMALAQCALDGGAGITPRVKFITLDSDSPVSLRGALKACELKKTLVLVASKSGSTLEMRCMLAALKEAFCACMSEKQFKKQLVAITDPDSSLEQRAREEEWAAVLLGKPSVGGRFSALSVFGLFPAALMGIDLKKLLKCAVSAEKACAKNASSNPASKRASFLFENYSLGRNKLAFLCPDRLKALGLWVEQLIAESTGKNASGILPYLESDTLLLAHPESAQDRMVFACSAECDSLDEQHQFQTSLEVTSSEMSRMDDSVSLVYDLAEQFVIWEYATAMCSHLMQVDAFNQPDVVQAKKRVLEILQTDLSPFDLLDDSLGSAYMSPTGLHVSECCAKARDVRSALKALFLSMEPGDYFALNAFLPSVGEGRAEALETLRWTVAHRSGVTSCLEIGPRFLHSTGQLQKGGFDKGVFLVLSADEAQDVALADQPASSLAHLAQAQATGDALTLIEANKRCLHLHLPDNSAVVLRQLGRLIEEVLLDMTCERSA